MIRNDITRNGRMDTLHARDLQNAAGIPHGYQPIYGDLDKSNPPQNGSGVPNPKAAVTCPVCHGTGHVDAGFYRQTSGQWSSAGGQKHASRATVKDSW